MKSVIIFVSLLILQLVLASPSFAQGLMSTSDTINTQGFIAHTIQVFTILTGTISAGFFAMGGFGYISSSGRPEGIEKAKKMIMYSAIGLSLTSGAYLLTILFKEFALNSFGITN